jgi:hypothetical protein
VVRGVARVKIGECGQRCGQVQGVSVVRGVARFKVLMGESGQRCG